MGKIGYEIAPSAEGWEILRNGEKGMTYVTAEAAFEVAVGQASIEMRSDHEIVIAVRRPNKDESAAADRPVPPPR